MLHHLAMKFPSPSSDIITIDGDQRLVRECYMASLRPQLPVLQTHNIERQPGSGITLSDEDRNPIVRCDLRIEPVEETRTLELSIGRILKLSAGLQQDHCDVLTTTLTTNANLFAWSAEYFPDVDPQIGVHKQSIYKEAKYISQKKRKLGEDQRLATKAKVEKLLDAGFIVEAHYTTWLSNVVLVKKDSGKWRMCVDYIDLNKAYPRHVYPLPSIDKLVDDTIGNKVFSFLDAYSGYNEIPMATTDMIKTAFITEDANYFYKVMPFKLKNAGATYQRLMEKSV